MASNKAPKWNDLTDLISKFGNIEKGLLERKQIFENVNSSDTANEKDKLTAESVIKQIDDIINDNNVVITNIKKAINKKTLGNPRAGVSPKDGQEYIGYMMEIENRFNATGSFDEMLILQLNRAIKGKDDE